MFKYRTMLQFYVNSVLYVIMIIIRKILWTHSSKNLRIEAMWRGVKDIPTVVCTCFLKDFFMFLVETSVYKNTKSTKRKRTPLNSVLNVWCDATMMVGAFLSYCIVYKIHWLRLFFSREKISLDTPFTTHLHKWCGRD